MNLTRNQEDIVNQPGNMIVNASAGTGKTHTMVSKIEKEIENNRSHRVIAAITFTIKAAKEIKNRLSIDVSSHFIGTNNSFVLEEIIKPFARDVYGTDYNIEMSTDYAIRLNSFSECLDYLKKNKTICSYVDSKKNFIFELALNIVKQSEACKLFLKAKYFKIYVDEYQDCDKTMHEFFMYLCKELKIELFVVGDEKQSIYIWRGAYPEAFKSILYMKEFHKMNLLENFRSCQMIQNYSNLLREDTNKLYKKDSNNGAIVLLNTTSQKWVEDVKPYIDLNRDCALLRFSNKNAEGGARELSDKIGKEFVFIPKTPLSEITTDVAWLYNAITQYCILPKYSKYDFMDEIPEESVGDKKIMSFVEDHLKKIQSAISEKNYDTVLECVRYMGEYFGYETAEEHTRKMIDTIADEKNHAAFRVEELSHVAITFHSSKGLEYEQVIVFANDYTLDKEDSIYNHYVAVTRAKNNLIIIKLADEGAWYGNKYLDNISEIFSRSKVRLEDVMVIK